MTFDSDESGDQKIDAALAAWLRGAAGDAVVLSETDSDRLFHRIDLHGIGPLLTDRANADALSDPIRRALRERLIARELWEAQHRRVLVRALQALIEADTLPLVFKGTALAWSLYPRPAMRVRGDSDVIIAADRVEAAFAALEAATFVRPATPGRTFRGETVFQGRDTMGRLHDLDLHWRMGNTHVIGRLFPHGELWERSVALDELAPGARRICNVDALLIACVHRRLHLCGWGTTEVNGVLHPTPDSLTWLMDIDLLMRALSEPEQTDLERRARSKGLGRIVSAALQDARSRLGTPVRDGLTRALADVAAAAPDTYIDATPMQRLVLDFQAMEGVAGKARFLRDIVLPPRSYLRARFPNRQHMPIIALYGYWAFDSVRDYLARGSETS